MHTMPSSRQGRIVDVSGPSKRVYQVWKGSNVSNSRFFFFSFKTKKFFLGGRLIFGPDAKSLLLTVCLILIPVILFAVFVSGNLMRELEHGEGSLIVSIVIIIAVYDIIILFVTSGRDPGIVPRNDHPPEPEAIGNSSTSEWSRNQSGALTLPPTKDVFVNGIVVKVKYCNTCLLYRPPRCSHCSICNNCVERFDHHCPWVGQCIGRRNYRCFFMFVSITTVLCLYVFAFCWVNLNMIMQTYECNIWKAVVKSPCSGVLIIYTFIAAWFVGGLTAFHAYLICTNQTTYENFRYRYDGKRNPYNRGCIKNVKEIFFAGIPKSMNNFRAKVKESTTAYIMPPHGHGPVMSPDSAKTSYGLEAGPKRHVMDSQEFDDIHSHIESTGEMERSRAQSVQMNWGIHRGNWEMSHDIESSDFGIQSGYTDIKDSGNQMFSRG